jgi:signal peptidase I
MRWFASPVKRGDAVVFNFPAGDTVIHATDFESAQPYYDIKRAAEQGSPNAKAILNDPVNYPVVVHPVDKSDNYIKRCVGIAGDMVQVKKDVVFINDIQETIPPNSEANYIVVTTVPLDQDVMKDEYGIDYDKEEYSLTGNKMNEYRMLLTAKAKDKMLKNKLATSIVLDELYNGGGGDVFPHDTVHKWTREDFGPIWIPKKGAPLQLTKENYSLYERAIRNYEKNEFYQKEGKFFLNGKEVTSYTFKMDYYWMMGDNRQGSQDSRYWGFVPEDRIVGKAWMIWFSWDGGPRWKRFFNIVK